MHDYPSDITKKQFEIIREDLEKYSGEPFAKEVKEIHGARVEVSKRNELHKFVVLPKR